MRILVTGAGGFIGARLVADLIASGFDVVAHSRKPKPSNALGIQWISGDLGKPITEALALDAIVHCASRNRLPAALPSEYLNDNVRAMERLLELAARTEVKKFIFLSSISVYGRVTDPVLDEATPCRFETDFGLSKLMCERLLAESSTQFSAIALRLPGVVGPGAHHVWLARLCQSLRQNDSVAIQNPESMHNNLLHVADLSRFVGQLLAGKDWQGFEAVNLAVDEAWPVRQVAETLKRAVGSDSPIIVEESQSLPYVIDSTLARKSFGFCTMPMLETLTRFAKEPR
ncbi:MAG: NAD(P)-dependent oxidoreductase [Alphaproteobacteria bacterium]|nr:NAD(P)-dependent oxidoreductase [Alphaproteobacteria bacterium]